MDAPLWGDTGGHTGTAPTNLHHIFPRIPTQTKYRLHTIHSNETNRPYQSPPNHAVCHYLITLYIRQFTPTTRGVPIPHRGYTFDSAGLASAT
ncbi:hypothetical protein [Segatella oulorum]|uniref:hypothetical protein n=1 Tax=Segatella oulorum TaxID=28136 RepID=UPI00058B00A0|nr:hypothetical protein [Segatella oulorum]